MTTIVSIDGVGAYDSISRKAMLEALVSMPGGSAALPFVRLFYGKPSWYLWEDEDGAIHHIHQGEGGEQEDAVTPLLFSHVALEAVRRRLRVGDRLFAFLDDIFVTTTPERVGWARLRCGMQQASEPQPATSWNDLHRCPTRKRECGRDPTSHSRPHYWHCVGSSKLCPHPRPECVDRACSVAFEDPSG